MTALMNDTPDTRKRSFPFRFHSPFTSSPNTPYPSNIRYFSY